MIKAIIFDCFGVLITDALESIVASLRTTEPEKAAQIISTIVAANKGIIDFETSRNSVANVLGITPDEYGVRIRDGEVKNTELLMYIADLRKHYRTGLLSNINSHGLEVRFEPGELDKYFDTVVASGAIGFAKPEAQAYEITAERLGVRLDECVMVDDREVYCEGARAVGMQAILYMNVDALKIEITRLVAEST